MVCMHEKQALVEKRYLATKELDKCTAGLREKNSALRELEVNIKSFKLVCLCVWLDLTLQCRQSWRKCRAVSCSLESVQSLRFQKPRVNRTFRVQVAYLMLYKRFHSLEHLISCRQFTVIVDFCVWSEIWDDWSVKPGAGGDDVGGRANRSRILFHSQLRR